MKTKGLFLLMVLVAVIGSAIYVIVREPGDTVAASSDRHWTDGKGDQPAPPPRSPNSSKDYKQ